MKSDSLIFALIKTNIDVTRSPFERKREGRKSVLSESIHLIFISMVVLELYLMMSASVATAGYFSLDLGFSSFAWVSGYFKSNLGFLCKFEIISAETVFLICCCFGDYFFTRFNS
jgi:hypothetical protein